jgi:hypothetical protein
MGARINFLFDDGSEALPVLYSHWGANNWKRDISQAFDHASARWGDNPYWVRMVISHMLKNELMSATGFGIYAISRAELVPDCFHDSVVIIDIEGRSCYEGDTGETFQIDKDSGKFLYNYDVEVVSL